MDGQRTNFQVNNNLLSIILSYLTCRDLSQFTQVNKTLHSFVDKVCVNIWREECNSFFCSSYEKNRIVDIESMNATSLFSSIRSNQKAEFDLFRKKNISFINNDSFNWKLFFSNGINIRVKWDKYIENLTGIPKEDLSEMKASLYSYLKEFSGFPKLRKKNMEVENAINTQFQLFLYDYLGNEEELYEECNELLNPERKNSGCSTGSNMLTLKDYPFSVLIDNPSLLVRDFQINQKSLLEFQELRWYLFSNIKSGTFSNDNIVLFILKILFLTLEHYCLMSYNYLIRQKPNKNNTFNNVFITSSSQTDDDEEFLQKYYMRYKNYSETAIEFNDRYKHINIIVNYIYEQFNTFNFPKFSLLRMFMIIWHNDVTRKLAPEINSSLSTLFSFVLENDLNGIGNFRQSINDSIDERENAPTLDTSYSFDFSSIIKSNTHNLSSNCFYSSFSNCWHQRLNDSEANSVKKEVISSVISCYNDTFCNEYNIFEINLSDIQTDSNYLLIEKSLCSIIDEKVTIYYNMRMKNNKKTLHKFVIEEILKYFDHSQFFSKKFINKLRLKIYKTVSETIKKILMMEITNLFIKDCSDKKKYRNKSLPKNFMEYVENEEIFSTLLDCLKNLDMDEETKQYLVFSFYQKHKKQNSNLINAFEIPIIWYRGKTEKDNTIMKQVKKEIKRRNLNFYFDEYKKKFLSFSWIPNINEVRDYINRSTGQNQM